ncbi:MAG: IS3 family transposase, partial [Dactylosporangium sp.]|nr:IS3 family transposase [Dactylosporangium sp.]
FMCRMLHVSTQGFYQWSKRPTSQHDRDDITLTSRIKQIAAAHKGRLGVRRVRVELAHAGVVCSHKRVHRLMRAAGLRSRHPRPYKRSTTPDRFDTRPVRHPPGRPGLPKLVTERTQPHLGR